MHFKNKTVWITGASSGIGAELARQLAIQGARLILSARNVAALEAVAATCRQAGAACAVLPADMLQATQLPETTANAIAVYGHIEIVVLSAGSSQRSLASQTELHVYRYLMELNFFAPLIITQQLLPHFKETRKGHIVAISSMAGLMGYPLRTGYAASKHALKGFFETLQTEQQQAGLHITIVSPGRVNTPISLNAVLADGSTHGRMDKGQLNGIPVEVCARKILAGMQKRKKHLIIARSEQILWWLWWFARPLYYRIARKKGLAQS